jgi:pimeloyl-ACP methyl ester carboxylesterase
MHHKRLFLDHALSLSSLRLRDRSASAAAGRLGSRCAAASPTSCLFSGVLLLFAFLMMPMLIARAAEPTNGFVPLGEAHSFKDAPAVTEWRFEDVRGASPMDKIGLHHVAIGKTPPENPELVILYLPGTNMNGIVAPDDVKHSLALYLATHGVDFWAMDYRTHYVPPEKEQSDLTELKGWTYDLFASDIDEAVKFVREHTRHGKIFLVGFSRGVTNEYLYTALHPENVQGIVVLDGFLSRRAPKEAPADVYADDIGGAHLTYDKRKTLMQMVIANPEGPAPIQKYKTARENLEHVVYDSAAFGGNGGLANPQGGKSDAVELAKLLITYDRYWPAVQNFENPFTPDRLAALQKSQVPVIAFSSTNFGADWPSMVEQSAHSTGSKSVSFSKLDGAGHVDVLCGTLSEQMVFAPSLEFIKQHRK